jgi:hypothetical protein
MTRAPALAQDKAQARPMPRPPPVTNTVKPSSGSERDTICTFERQDISRFVRACDVKPEAFDHLSGETDLFSI